jgi:hypothetical protein
MSREEINGINLENSDYNTEYLKTNLSFNLEKVKEIDSLLKKASKGIYLPVKKIFDFYSNHLNLFKKKLKALKKDADKITSDAKEGSSNSSNSNLSGYSSTLSNEESEILKNLLSSTISIIGLFNNLFNTSQFDDLVKSLPQEIKNLKNEILSEDENCFKEGFDKDSKGIKHRLIGKKKKRSCSEEKNSEKNKIKSKKKSRTEEEEDETKIKFTDEEATELMKEKFKDKLKCITKTFLTRKLTKSITWSGEFNLADADPWKNQREVVKSATYKYTKLTISLSEPPLDIMDLIKCSFKKYICKLGNKKFVVGGEMNDELYKFLEIFKDIKTINNFKIVFLKVDVYAFLEELCQEFEYEGDSILHNFTEEEIASYKSEWSIIQEMREAWKSFKGIK